MSMIKTFEQSAHIYTLLIFYNLQYIIHSGEYNINLSICNLHPDYDVVSGVARASAARGGP